MSDLMKPEKQHPWRNTDSAPSLAETHPKKSPDHYNSPFPDTAQEDTTGKFIPDPRFSESLEGPNDGQDRDLQKLAQERLREHAAIDPTGIEVSVEAGVVMLSGSVPDQRMKVEAEKCLRNVPGTSDVLNQLTVSH